jgi:hypothetical protein
MITKIGTPMRFFFMVASAWLWLGIWLTGFTVIHWVIYIPAGFFLFAAATGICPGIIISNALFSRKISSSESV